MTKTDIIHSQADPQWHGYTVDELRYQRAYLLARTEMTKQRLAEHFRDTTSVLRPGTSGTATLATRILSSISYFDYALLAIKVGRSLFKFTRRMRRR